jgi:hypothetical protein
VDCNRFFREYDAMNGGGNTAGMDQDDSNKLKALLRAIGTSVVNQHIDG